MKQDKDSDRSSSPHRRFVSEEENGADVSDSEENGKASRGRHRRFDARRGRSKHEDALKEEKLVDQENYSLPNGLQERDTYQDSFPKRGRSRGNDSTDGKSFKLNRLGSRDSFDDTQKSKNLEAVSQRSDSQLSVTRKDKIKRIRRSRSPRRKSRSPRRRSRSPGKISWSPRRRSRDRLSRERRSRDRRSRDRRSRDRRSRERDRHRRKDDYRSLSKDRKRDKKNRASKSPPSKPVKKSKWDMAEVTDVGPSLPGFGAYSAGFLPPLEDRRGRRLYVGNLPPGISETAIVQFFNGALLAAAGVDYAVAAASGQFPALKAEVGPRRIDASGQYLPDHRYCFVEFRTIADTSICLKLDGISFNGFTLKIGRPNDYTHIPKPQEMSTTESLSTGSVVSTLAKMMPETKVYVSDLPLTVTELELKRIAEAFGIVRSAALMKDLRTGQSMGCGIIEFDDPVSTDAAVAALDNKSIGGKIVRFTKGPLVPRAVSKLLEPTTTSVGPTSSVVTELPTSMTHKVLSNAIIGAQVQAARRDGSIPSTVLQFLNTVFPEDLIKDEDYASIMEEIRDAASEYGTILEIVIPRPPPDLSFKPGVGKVFIHYADITAARKAQAEFNGRRYEERRVVCTAFYPLDRFKEGKYTLIQ